MMQIRKFAQNRQVYYLKHDYPIMHAYMLHMSRLKPRQKQRLFTYI